MKILPISQYPDKLLRTVLAPVINFDDELKTLIENMTETMLSPDDTEDAVRGVGLAANQVGVNARVIIVTMNADSKSSHKIVPMVNPEVIHQSTETCTMEEGCLSLPGVFHKILRPRNVQVRWKSVQGNICEKRLKGWDARIFLHENDHLNGKMFIDYVKGSKLSGRNN